jgi:hypothetical protein
MTKHLIFVGLILKDDLLLKECCLCCMRGGALKPTTNGKWAHIVCALTIQEIKFDNIPKREPINIDGCTNRVRLVRVSSLSLLFY